MNSNHVVERIRAVPTRPVDFNAESQRCRVMERKSEVLRGNGKYKNFSDRVNLHQLGVACMVLQK